MPPLEVRGHGLPQREDALGRRVAVVTVPQRLDRRLDDVLRRLEVGLADSEIDDVAALTLKLAGARQHFECGFGPEPLQILCKLQH